MSRRPAAALTVLCDWAGRAPAEELLGPRERAYAATLPGWRRLQWGRGRLTAKAALLLASGGRSPAAEILADPAGAPVPHPPAPAAPALSLSHAGTTVACAAGETGPLGVDLEPVDERNVRALPRVLAPGERVAALGATPAARATLAISCKEAAVKAYGRPSARLASYRVTPTGIPGLARVAFVPPPAAPPPAARGPLRAWHRLHGDLVLVVAGRVAPPRVRVVRADEVLALVAGAARPGEPGEPGVCHPR